MKSLGYLQILSVFQHMRIQLLSLQLKFFINCSPRHPHDLCKRKRKADQEICLVQIEHSKVRYYSIPRSHCNFGQKRKKGEKREINKMENNPKSFTICTMFRKQMLTQTFLISQFIPEKARYNFNFIMQVKFLLVIILILQTELFNSLGSLIHNSF